MFEESAVRSMIKAISWRVLATLTTTALVYAVTGRTDLAVTIGLLEATSKMVLYYFHERMWNRLNIGRTPIAGTRPAVEPALASPGGKPE
jgi:adenylylsulfate kinase